MRRRTRPVFAVAIGLAHLAIAGEPGFWLVGAPDGFSRQWPAGLSADGELLVGTSSRVASPDLRQFEFTSETGRLETADPLKLSAFFAISPAGRYVATISPAYDPSELSRVIDRTTGAIVRSFVPIEYSGGAVRDLGDSGSAVGFLQFELVPGVSSRHACVVSPRGDVRVLSSTIGSWDIYSDANAVSNDGRVVVGGADPAEGYSVAVRWTDGVPLLLRGLRSDDPYADVVANGISGDGKFIVGAGYAVLPGGIQKRQHGVLWRSPTDVVDLNSGFTRRARAFAVSDDGEIVIGQMEVVFPPTGQLENTAAIWTASSGMVPLKEYLASKGVELPQDLWLWTSNHLSADGLTIAGVASFPQILNSVSAFVVRLPPPPCFADFNADGGIDGSDIEPFFAAWEGGEPAADVNQDGGVDMGDVQTFFTQWESGACGR